jgi:signal transduction histidine kinase/CheY-like chemotaxis protein
LDHSFDFLPSQGELADLIRVFDWAATPLGPSDQWPASLKTILNIVLTSNHPMFIWWERDLIQFYNDAYRKTMGPERHPSALGKPGRECSQEIWAVIGPQIDSIMAGGASTWHEDQLVSVTSHGKFEEVWWTYGYTPIRDAAGVRGVLVICNDVTKEHLFKAELAKEVNLRRYYEAERLKVLFQQAPGFVCGLRGPQHIFEFANDAYLRLVGNREILGKSVREAIPEAEEQGFLELLDQVFATGKPFFAQDVPLSLRRGPGASLTQLFVDFVYQPIAEPDGSISGIFVAGSDVTERKCAEERLKEADQRKDEFLATLAHELRNPLAPIVHALALIAQPDGAASVPRLLPMISRQVDYMVRLVDDLLEISRITRGKVELRRVPTNLLGVVRNAIEANMPGINEKQLELSVSLPQTPLIVQGDAVRLEQVLTNLLNNALRYTPNCGHIWVAAWQEDNSAVVSIRDNGIGILPGMLPRLFEMFSQERRGGMGTQGGVGIGLCLVDRLVKMHGGTVEARSEGKDKGSEFIVRLPLRQTQTSEKMQQPEKTALAKPGTRVLVVDDNHDAAEVLCMLLQSIGVKVEVVNSGPAALAAIPDYRPNVILMDIGMPGMDGNEVARRIRQQPEFNDIKLIALTGWGQEKDRQRSKESGFDHHLTKPVNFKTLSDLIASI